MTVKLSHERKVRSLAKKTLGSTRVGRAIRLPDGLVRECMTHRSYGCDDLPGAVWRSGCDDILIGWRGAQEERFRGLFVTQLTEKRLQTTDKAAKSMN